MSGVPKGIRIILWVICVSLVVAFVGAALRQWWAGCFLNRAAYETTCRDVTEDTAYWGGYKRNAVYELQVTCFLLGDEIVEEDYFRHDAEWPASFEEYDLSPARWPDVRIVEQGTRVRCEQLLLFDGFSTGWLAVRGPVVLGDMTGQTISVRRVSLADETGGTSDESRYTLRPDPRYLILVAQ